MIGCIVLIGMTWLNSVLVGVMLYLYVPTIALALAKKNYTVGFILLAWMLLLVGVSLSEVISLIGRVVGIMLF